MNNTTRENKPNDLQAAGRAVIGAIEYFRLVMRDPVTGRAAEFGPEQQAAYDAVCETVETLEAIRATQS